MSDALGTFIDQAWTDHADDAWAVSQRLPQALDLVRDEAGLLEAARLAHHVYGEHLARWADALKFMAALARGPGFDAQGESGRLLQEFRAGLALAAGESDVRGTLAPSARIAVTARAAMLLAGHDAVRCRALLDEAVAAAEAAALPDDDPAIRALAVAGNNGSGALKDKAGRSPAETDLMLHLAEVARRNWARAGTWLQTERADWNLAQVCMAAGDAARARRHALDCLALVDAQPEPAPLERFFGSEALARAERALGHTAEAAAAVAAARSAFDALPAADQAWCRKTLDALAA